MQASDEQDTSPDLYQTRSQSLSQTKSQDLSQEMASVYEQNTEPLTGKTVVEETQQESGDEMQDSTVVKGEEEGSQRYQGFFPLLKNYYTTVTCGSVSFGCQFGCVLF